jgi:hypothetical protein
MPGPEDDLDAAVVDRWLAELTEQDPDPPF